MSNEIQLPPESTPVSLPETLPSKRKKPLWRRILAFAFYALVIVLALAAALETYQRIRDSRDYPMPGRLVDIGTHRMHLWCEGDAIPGQPTVLMDAGAIAFSTSWRAVMPLVEKFARACSFDRSGFGWSEAGPGPWDANQAADELALLLQASGERAPVIYVGHSLGAMHARVFADRHPEQVAGLLLLEPADPDIIIAELNEDREKPLTRDTPDPNCGMRCFWASLGSWTGLVRWVLSDQPVLQDPRLPQVAVAEFVSRSVRPENIRHLVIMGRYFPIIFFQTKDNQSLGDIPLIMGYGSRTGELLGDHETEEEWERDFQSGLAAWQRTGELSSRFLGMREVIGANHLSLTTYPEHAEKVAEMIVELIDEATISGRTGG